MFNYTHKFNPTQGCVKFPHKTIDFPMSKYSEWKDLLKESWGVQRPLTLTRYMMVEVTRTIAYKK